MVTRAVMPRRRTLLLGLAILLVLVALVAIGRAALVEKPYDLPGSGHEKGNPEAAIVLIEFADFGCSACAVFAHQTLPLIEKNWIATGRARLRLIPFDALRTGRAAAQAAECAAQQDAFWPMHDLLFARHKEWLMRRRQREIFEGWATELGLDRERFRACWVSDTRREWLKRNNELARTHGVPGTPAFVLNGRPIVGALPYADFAAALEVAAAATR